MKNINWKHTHPLFLIYLIEICSVNPSLYGVWIPVIYYNLAGLYNPSYCLKSYSTAIWYIFSIVRIERIAAECTESRSPVAQPGSFYVLRRCCECCSRYRKGQRNMGPEIRAVRPWQSQRLTSLAGRVLLGSGAEVTTRLRGGRLSRYLKEKVIAGSQRVIEQQQQRYTYRENPL